VISRWLEPAFAAAYDPMLARSERLGLSRWRAELLADLTGDVLIVGAGTGLDLPHLPAGARAVLLEPSAPMRRRLQRRWPDAEVIDGVAEALPFDDGRFDAAVCHLVLCTVDDPERSLAELHRVLRPGGALVCIEHVASRRPLWRGLQRLLDPAWQVLACGCHLTRDTEAAVQRAGFTWETLDRSDLPGGAAVVRDAIHGVARR
jgi:SAM-dependent methyltransferase